MICMDNYIQEVKKYLTSAIEEKNLNFVGTLIYELIHYAIIIKQENLIFLSSIIKDSVIGYDMIINDYELPENIESQLLETFKSLLNRALDFLDKSELTQQDKIDIFNWSKNAKVQLEKDIYEIRAVKKYKRKSIEEFIQ